MTPDLLFANGLATGDVKYKLTTGEWNRADLYQAVAFATAFRSNSACVISFAAPSSSPPPPVRVGDVNLEHFAWPADADTPPPSAAETLIQKVDTWLSAIR